MYIRFVSSDRLPGSPARLGIFHAAVELSRDPFLPGPKQRHLQALIDRISEPLDAPERFSRSRAKNAAEKETPGLCWFKPEAAEFIEGSFALKHFLDAHGHPIDVLRTQRIGYVIWEDEVQIVAKPFSDTPV